MTMLILWIVKILAPFLKLTILTNLHLWEFAYSLGKSLLVFSILTKNNGSLHCLRQCIAYNLVVHRTACAHR